MGNGSRNERIVTTRKQGCVSKTITSPSARWVGTATLAKPLTMVHAEAIDAALIAIREYGGAHNDLVPFAVIDREHLRAVLACTEKWDIHGEDMPDAPTLETFPMSPAPARRELIDWLWNELYNGIYFAESQIPNGSSPTLTDTQAEDDHPQS